MGQLGALGNGLRIRQRYDCVSVKVLGRADCAVVTRDAPYSQATPVEVFRNKYPEACSLLLNAGEGCGGREGRKRKQTRQNKVKVNKHCSSNFSVCLILRRDGVALSIPGI